MFDSQYHTTFYKTFAKQYAVIAASNIGHHNVLRYDLSPPQMRDFLAGKLSLVTPGCCSPSGGKFKSDCTVLATGPFTRIRHWYKALFDTGLFPELERKNDKRGRISKKV